MGDSDSKTPDAALPTERAREGGVVGRHMEGIEAAMKLQAEILKRLHDQQEEMGKALKDSTRSEMMIQSTRSLNESFSGMKRVQERLIDRLGSYLGAAFLEQLARLVVSRLFHGNDGFLVGQ